MKATFLRAAIALLVCCRLTGLPVNAQSWPTLPITMIITFGGGGGGDTIAWLFAKFASSTSVSRSLLKTGQALAA
jgi:tripartite-type tricarboxylate transporter receptor subunit TctC